MSFTADNAATIRDRALADWRTRYLARGEDIDITEGSDAYNEIDALSLEFEGLAIGAQEAARRVLLRYAVGGDLDDFAEDDGTARKPASAARRVIRLAGPTSTSTPVANASLATVGGLRFVPIDPTTGAALTAITTDGAGAANVTCQCTTTGTATNIPAGTVLTWSSAPTGFAATGTVVTGGGTREGENAESNDALRERLLERRKERPASGNRADWRAWAMECAGVGEAFVHPCTAPPQPPPAPFLDQSIRADRLGCTVVIPVNPAPAAGSYVQNDDGSLGAGLDPAYSRRPSQDLCDNIARYIDGTHGANGVEVAESAQRQLYPATIDRANWGVVRPEVNAFEVAIAVRVAPSAAFAFDGARSVSSATSASQMVLSNVANVAVGTKLAFKFNAVDADGLPTVIRGGWALGTVATVNSGTREITLASPLPATPPTSTPVRAASGAWGAVRAAVLAYFDALGAGAPDGLGRSARFPPVEWGDPADVVAARLLVAALGVTGVLDADAILLSPTDPTELGHLVVPSFFTLTRKET